MNVVDLEQRRAARSDDDVARCTCGSEWFELRRRPTDPVEHGAIAMRSDGGVRAVVGQPTCVECGEDWAPYEPPALH